MQSDLNTKFKLIKIFYRPDFYREKKNHKKIGL